VREAKAAGALNHPNIVSVYDYGMVSTDRPYIVMELLDGINLDGLLERRGYLTPELTTQIITQVCEALAHAHERGLIHRDLKPSNIMLVNNKNKQYVKIIDFGIAKFATKKPETRPITKPGQIFGSPLYMSPEQCTGQKLDARSDIYSLGCVMYETLCGVPPFLGDTLLSTIYKHVNENPPRFSEHMHGRTVPSYLEALVLKMLEKQPEDRFQSAEEILATFEQHPITQSEPTPTTLKQNGINKLLHDRKFRMIASIVLAVAMAIAFKVIVDIQDRKAHPILKQHSGYLREPTLFGFAKRC